MQIIFLCKGSSNIEFDNYKSVVNAIYLKLFLPCSFEILHEWSQNFVIKFYDLVNYGFSYFLSLCEFSYISFEYFFSKTFIANSEILCHLFY